MEIRNIIKFLYYKQHWISSVFTSTWTFLCICLKSICMLRIFILDRKIDCFFSYTLCAFWPIIVREIVIWYKSLNHILKPYNNRRAPNAIFYRMLKLDARLLYYICAGRTECWILRSKILCFVRFPRAHILTLALIVWCRNGIFVEFSKQWFYAKHCSYPCYWPKY